MSRKDSTVKTIVVAALLCVVCATMVSSLTVALKEKQEENKEVEKKRNILKCAGLIKDKATNAEVKKTFEQIRPIVIDLATGEEVKDKDIDPNTYDQRKAAKDPKMNVKIPKEIDKNGIGKRAKYSLVYLVKQGEEVEQIILPVHGQGLWSTLYGFLALDKDTTTVKGFAYYEHGETPGLGGEVDNPKWKNQWPDKKVYNDQWKPAIHVIKGAVDPNSKGAEHQIDGLAGATITSNGITNSIQYWLGDHGFGPFLEKMRKEHKR